MKVGSLEIDMLTNLAKLQADMTAAKSTVEKAMGGIDSAVSMAKKSLAGLAAGLTIGAFAAMVKGSIDAAEHLHDLSITTGATVEALSGLASIGKFTDTSVDTIAGAMTKLARNMAGATEDTKGTGKALDALGIDFNTFKQLKPEEQFQEVAKQMANFADGSGKAAVAQALFGKEGAALLPMMKDLATAGDLQAKVTAEQAAEADNFNDNITRLQAQSNAWKKQISMAMLPALNEFLQAFIDISKGAGGIKEEIARLAKDGTITEWTRMVLNGASYVIDAFAGVIRVVKHVGAAIGALMAYTDATLGSVQNAMLKAVKGDLSGAMEELRRGGREGTAILANYSKDVQDMWSETTLGSKIRARAAELKGVSFAGEETKKALDFTNVMDKNAKKGKDVAKAQAQALMELVNGIKEKIANNQKEVELGRELTDAEKQHAEIEKMVANGKISAAQASKLYASGLLEQLAASEKAKKSVEEFNKSLKENADALNKKIDDAEKAAVEAEKELKTQKEQNEAIGKTTLQIAALERAKADDRAATLERRAELVRDLDPSGAWTDSLMKQAAAVRALAKAKQEGATKQFDSKLFGSQQQSQDFNEQLDAFKRNKDNPAFTEADKQAEKERFLRSNGVDTNTLQIGLQNQLNQLQRYYDNITVLQQNEVLGVQEAEQAKAQIRQRQNELNLQGTSDMFGQLAVLANSSNKTLGTIGRAAAIAQATIQGILAVQRALASAPPPFNYAMAAAVGIAAAANVAKIAGVKGFSAGGYTGDGARHDVAGVVHGKEFVVNADATAKNRQVLENINSGGSGGGAPTIIFDIKNNIEVSGSGSQSSGDDLKQAATTISKKTQADIMESIRMGGDWAKIIRAK
jgi:hypothetical protein